MDFDRLTITLLELRDDAPGLTPAQQDALQDAHMAHLAGLHEAGHLLAAGPLLDRDSPFRGLSILCVGVAEARALMEADPAVRAGKYRIIALPWMVPAGNGRLTCHLPAVCSRGRRILTAAPAARQGCNPLRHRTPDSLELGGASARDWVRGRGKRNRWTRVVPSLRIASCSCASSACASIRLIQPG